MTGDGMRRSVGLGLLLALACPLVLAAQAVPADSLAQAANAAAAANTVAINFVWTLVAGFLVMFMQAGFAMVETGFTRAKNAAHTITMNFMVYGIAMLAYWVVGFALQAGGVGALGTLGGYDKLAHEISLTIGGNEWGLFGGTGFFLTGVAYAAPVFTYFLFQMVFMDTAATIPTGALAVGVGGAGMRGDGAGGGACTTRRGCRAEAGVGWRGSARRRKREPARAARPARTVSGARRPAPGRPRHNWKSTPMISNHTV